MSDLNGNTLTYSYTGEQLTAVTDGAGRSLDLEYEGAHLKPVTDPNVTPHRVVTFHYDEAGNLAEVVDVARSDSPGATGAPVVPIGAPLRRPPTGSP